MPSVNFLVMREAKHWLYQHTLSFLNDICNVKLVVM